MVCLTGRTHSGRLSSSGRAAVVVTLEISPRHTHAQTATRHKLCQWPLVSTEGGHSYIFEARRSWDFQIFAQFQHINT